MTAALNVIAVAGSSYRPSRTLVLAEELLSQISQQLSRAGRTVNSQVIELGSIARSVGGALQRSELPAEVEAQVQAIESADLLIVASPVYRGSYPGLLKHLFDLVDMNALIDTPVLLAATGGSERHALVIDHQLRPLFSFFQSLTLPIGVYASEADFLKTEGVDYQVSNELLKARIQLAVERALPLFTSSTLQKIA